VREIKFRAWDRERKEMLMPEKLCHLEGEMSKNLKEVAPYLELMQYTGLKDKNGEDIYEGDILKINNENMEVFFQDGYFGWGKDHNGVYSFDPFESEQTEIIGNIYDNPNLLSVK